MVSVPKGGSTSRKFEALSLLQKKLLRDFLRDMCIDFYKSTAAREKKIKNIPGSAGAGPFEWRWKHPPLVRDT